MKKFSSLVVLTIIMASCTPNREQKNMVETAIDTVSTVPLFPSSRVEIKTVGILLYDGFSNLDAIGPYAVFSSLMGTKVFFVGTHKGVVQDARGMKVQVDTSINEVSHLDILLIPGGLQETYELTRDEALLSWIKKIDNTSKYTTSVCTGAWILGATGLLEGKNATTHWYGKKILAENFGANIKDTRYTHSGKYWTSAGITAGMDMSLAILMEIAGEEYTKVVMLDLEYDPQPPIRGGSETNTDKELVETVRAMYDSGMDAILHPEKLNTDIKLENSKDMVCGMAIPASVNDTAYYEGKIYGFCSPMCKAEFKNHPKRYVAN